jgi:ribonuclease BN (tRNA processing enzyme)
MTLGYLVQGPGGKRVAYMTDNELVINGEDFNRARLVELISGSDVLIHDANYLDQEYPSKVGWGHSSMTEVLKLAADAKVKKLYLYHHDLHHDDETVSAKESFGRQYFAERKLDIECVAAAEGESVAL